MSAAAAAPLLRLSGLEVSYAGRSRGWRRAEPVHAVAGVGLDIMPGEAVGLVGESGCGKSSIAKAVVRLVRPSGGSILFDGVDLAQASRRTLRPLRRRIQIIFQDPYGSLDPRHRVGSIVAEPLRIHGLASGNREGRVIELLQLVGLDGSFARRYPHELSGGQRQRVGIARALAVEPELLICDEPVSALDVSIQAQILNLLCDLRERLSLTYLFISHNLAAVVMACDRIAVMYLGQIVELGGAAEVQASPAHPYTRALLSAAPVADPVVERQRQRIVMPGGELLVPGAEDEGCSFRSRCWLHRALGAPNICASTSPAAHEIAPGHTARCHFPREARVIHSG